MSFYEESFILYLDKNTLDLLDYYLSKYKDSNKAILSLKRLRESIIKEYLREFYISKL